VAARGRRRTVVGAGRCVRVVVRCWLTVASGMVRTPRNKTPRMIGVVVGFHWSVFTGQLSVVKKKPSAVSHQPSDGCTPACPVGAMGLHASTPFGVAAARRQVVGCVPDAPSPLWRRRAHDGGPRQPATRPYRGEWAGADVAVWIPDVILFTGSTKKSGAAGPHPTRLGRFRKPVIQRQVMTLRVMPDAPKKNGAAGPHPTRLRQLAHIATERVDLSIRCGGHYSLLCS